MKYLLDTNTCIAVLTGREPLLAERWKRARAHEIRLSTSSHVLRLR